MGTFVDRLWLKAVVAFGRPVLQWFDWARVCVSAIVQDQSQEDMQP